jgi:two-component system sensor kinase FixL
MGIGLASARTIVEAHGGEIWAEPQERGAVFCFTLPLVATAAAADSVPVEPRPVAI